MNLTKKRVVLTALGVGLSALISRVGVAALGAYKLEKNHTAASVASLGSNLWLVQSSSRIRRHPRAYQPHDSAPSATLNAKSSTAAAAELARLIANAIGQDTVSTLTIMPERDSTALATLHRSALTVRFETSTDGLVEFLSNVLNATTLVRIDAIRTTAQPGRDGVSPVRLSLEVRVSAWFMQQAL